MAALWLSLGLVWLDGSILVEYWWYFIALWSLTACYDGGRDGEGRGLAACDAKQTWRMWRCHLPNFYRHNSRLYNPIPSTSKGMAGHAHI